MCKLLTILNAILRDGNHGDEFTRECLAIRVDRKLKSTGVIDILPDLFVLRGLPAHVRSDNVLCWDRRPA